MYKLLLFFTLFADLPTIDEAILFLSGASSMEELQQSEIEAYENLNQNRIKINFAKRSRLISSGLFSNFQISSLLEYRSSFGDILSLNELSLINGFDEDSAKALSYFLDFSGELSDYDSKTYHHKIMLNYKQSDNSLLKVKYNAQLGNMVEAFWSVKNDLHSDFDIGTISIAYYGHKYLNKLIVGNFNSKFGQGLCSWTAFNLSGYSSVASFVKNPSGFVPTGSFSAANYGLCSEFSLLGFDFSIAYSINNKELISNITWNSKSLSLGATATLNKASIDWKLGKPNLCYFGEISSNYKGNCAALMGLYYSPVYGEKYAIQARYFDAFYKQYSGLALGMEKSWIITTADFGYRLDKQIFQIKPLLLLKNHYANLRWVMRYRSGEKIRNDLRLDLTYSLSSWTAVLRLNALYCNSLAFLTYLQIGRKTDKLGFYSRLTYYNISSWEDRIYAYQQEAPGGFNVPAFYGCGFAAYIYAFWKINTKNTLYLRCEYRKSLELQIQYNWKI